MLRWSARFSGWVPWPRSVVQTAPARSRSRFSSPVGVHPPRAPLVDRGRHPHLRAHAGAGRRLRPDSAGGPGRETPTGGRMDRVVRAARRLRRPARAPLRECARDRTRRARRHDRARRGDAAGVAGCGDRAVSLNAFAAAARVRPALQLWPDDDPERPRLLLSAAKAREGAEVWIRTSSRPWQMRCSAPAIALGLQRPRSSAPKCSGTWGGETRSSRPWSYLPLAEELPPSPTKAWVYATIFRMHWLAMRFDLAERFEAEALAMADDLGLKESARTSSAPAAPCGLEIRPDSTCSRRASGSSKS